MGLLPALLDPQGAVPLGACMSWRPELHWSHAGSDGLLALSCLSIAIVLGALLSKRTDMVFNRVFWGFTVFLVACGTSHAFDLWTIWQPHHGLSAVAKAVAAVAAVGMAIALWPLLPKALSLPSSDALRRANAALRREVAQHQASLAALDDERQERRRTQEMLHQSQKMDAIGQLTAGIAHDFNNLMTAVIGNLERARRLLPADGSNQLNRAIRGAALGAERAGVLTHRLLAFGRRQALAPTIVNVNDVIEHVADTLRRTLGGNIRVVTELTFDLWRARVDPDALESAILNLAVNARDAMPEGGDLVITTRNIAAGCKATAELPPFVWDQIEIAVADTGMGMSEDVANRAFEPFFTTKPVGEGTGLGLSQAYGFAVQSHGAAVLESAPGKGTTVRLYLPRLQIAGSAQQARMIPHQFLSKAAGYR
jgi:signal transduction histidine kinase